MNITTGYKLNPIIANIHQSLAFRYGYISDYSLFTTSSSLPNTILTTDSSLSPGSLSLASNCINCALETSPGDLYFYYTGAIFHANVYAFLFALIFFIFYCIYCWTCCTVLRSVWCCKKTNNTTDNNINIDDTNNYNDDQNYTTIEEPIPEPEPEKLGFYNEYGEYEYYPNPNYVQPSSTIIPTKQISVTDNYSSSITMNNNYSINTSMSLNGNNTDVELVSSPKKVNNSHILDNNNTDNSIIPAATSSTSKKHKKQNKKQKVNYQDDYEDLPTSPVSDIDDTPLLDENKDIITKDNYYSNQYYNTDIEPTAPITASDNTDDNTNATTNKRRRTVIPLSIRRKWKEEEEYNRYNTTRAYCCCFTYRGCCMPGGYFSSSYRNWWSHPRYKHRFVYFQYLINLCLVFSLLIISYSVVFNNYNNSTNGIVTQWNILHDTFHNNRKNMGSIHIQSAYLYNTLLPTIYNILITNNAPNNIMKDYVLINSNINNSYIMSNIIPGHYMLLKILYGGHYHPSKQLPYLVMDLV